MKSPHVRTRPILDPSRLSGQGTGLNAHRIVAETAVAMANEHFEHYMIVNNALWNTLREHLTEKQARMVFVAKIAPMLLEEARLALTDCLTQPDDVCPKSLKDKIADALIKDTDLRANRLKAATHMPPGLLQ
jgi:hypothetical protein